ncbi:MAG: hypothetical protein V3U54_12765 [Thermodesulfobacteriota bacterium]
MKDINLLFEIAEVELREMEAFTGEPIDPILRDKYQRALVIIYYNLNDNGPPAK